MNQNKDISVKMLFEQENYKKRFYELLNKKAPQFISSVINVSNSQALKEVDDKRTIIQSAAVAATLDLPIDPNLGFAYIVPYNKKIGNRWEKQAQFQMGYKGYIQLAMRTGQYKTINAIEIYQGEIEKVNRLTGEIEFCENEDFINRDVVIGYMAYFKLLNGFEKTIYMTKEEMEKHAKKYSKVFAQKGTGLWKDDFDSMAIKTILKRLLSKYGILSIEMQEAITKDQAVVNEGSIEFVDNEVKEEISQNANKKIINIDDADVVNADFKEIDQVQQASFEEAPF